MPFIQEYALIADAYEQLYRLRIIVSPVMERLGSVTHIFYYCRIFARLHRLGIDTAHRGPAQGLELHFVNIASGRAVLGNQGHPAVHRDLGELPETLLPEGVEILLCAQRRDYLLRLYAYVEFAAVTHLSVPVSDGDPELVEARFQVGFEFDPSALSGLQFHFFTYI